MRKFAVRSQVTDIGSSTFDRRNPTITARKQVKAYAVGFDWGLVMGLYPNPLGFCLDEPAIQFIVDCTFSTVCGQSESPGCLGARPCLDGECIGFKNNGGDFVKNDIAAVLSGRFVEEVVQVKAAHSHSARRKGTGCRSSVVTIDRQLRNRGYRGPGIDSQGQKEWQRFP